MSTWLITGASRGIGREFVRQLLERGDTVFAAVRTLASAKTHLQEYENISPGKLHLIQLDVSDLTSVSVAAQSVKQSLRGRPLDYLINNAGIVLKGDYPSGIEPEILSQTLAINVIGPAIVFREFVSLLEHSERPVVVNIASGLASISSTNSGAPASYSISKAALNMLTVKQAKEKAHIICLAMDPGWVKTGTTFMHFLLARSFSAEHEIYIDMGTSSAPLDVVTSVKGQLQVITSARLEDSGTFKRYDGTNNAW